MKPTLQAQLLESRPMRGAARWRTSRGPGRFPCPLLAVLIALTGATLLRANPQGGVAAQGTAQITTSGTTTTVQTSDRTYINWASFNIAPNETTRFVQPSANSLVWNRINDVNPSQIMGHLDANGYVVLQNPAGIVIGGQAAITAHGVLLTTAPLPTPNLSGGGAWDFNTLPPTAEIINYGQITADNGGSIFLIAHSVNNQGVISAPSGKVELAAGKEVLVSQRPDGRGLSAVVTLPEGSVNNSGQVIADAGRIAMHAQVVNQGGLVQANSVQNVNGVIELVASGTMNLASASTVSAAGGNISLQGGDVNLDGSVTADNGSVTVRGATVNQNGTIQASAGAIAIHATDVNQNGTIRAGSAGKRNGSIELFADHDLELGASSKLLATGDSGVTTPSPGGFVVLRSSSLFGDTAGSTLNVAGANGGQDGVLQLLAAGAAADGIHSSVDNYFAFLVNPYDVTIAAGGSDLSSTYPTWGLADLSAYSRINLHALDNIELVSPWTLKTFSGAAGLSLTTGNALFLDDLTNLKGQAGWSISLAAGARNPEGGIYLNGNAYVETQDGNINAWAAKEVLVNADTSTAGNNGIRTLAGGSVTVKTDTGDINTGGNRNGYRFRGTTPGYTVQATASATVGGISTAAGGDVTIDAGGNIFSYLPTGTETSDAGSGAFGSLPGDVTIKAKQNIYGHFVLANGLGTVNAGQNAGGPDDGQNLALSLMKGSWDVAAPNGDIYLQEVRNPNGIFNALGNESSNPYYHWFDYDPSAATRLHAGAAVYLTGLNVPRPANSAPPIIYAPILEVSAGAGGITLGETLSLFPSALGDLQLRTTASGDLQAIANNPQNPPPKLIMSDSANTRWTSEGDFGDGDHGAAALQRDNKDAVLVEISGDMRNFILMTTRKTEIHVTGDMLDCSFSGQNLNAADETKIEVGGRIINRSPYNFEFLDPSTGIPLLSVQNLPPKFRATWDSIFTLAMQKSILDTLVVPPNLTPTQLTTYLSSALLFLSRPAFSYNPKTGRLGFTGQMSDTIRDVMKGDLYVVRYEDGLPKVDPVTRHFIYDKVSWGVPADKIESLYTLSQGAPGAADAAGLGYEVGGPGLFSVHANAISLGNTYGILTTGVGDRQGNHRFANLAAYTPSGANLKVTVDNDYQLMNASGELENFASLEMAASTIGALGGGNVEVTSTAGSMLLGSQDLADFQEAIVQAHYLALGIISTGKGNIDVTAQGDINIDSSRIATYNGGTIKIKSLAGDVNAGTGGSILSPVVTYYVNSHGQAAEFNESVFGSGILATTLYDPAQVPGSPGTPGDIIVDTPQGDIIASLGGIIQSVLNGTLAPGPKITLTAGTRPSEGSAGHEGNIDLGNSGVIGGAVNLDANGDITGLVISRQDSTINAAQNFNGTVLSGGTANLAAGGSVAGTIVGVGGVTASGGAGVTATVMSQNASVQGGKSESTLGTSATTSTASQAASQQANTEAKQQVSSNDQPAEDDSKKKKRPVLSRRSRVTVILPKSS